MRRRPVFGARQGAVEVCCFASGDGGADACADICAETAGVLRLSPMRDWASSLRIASRRACAAFSS